MEKHRTSVVSRNERFVWHSRKTLSFRQAQSRFYELHPDPRRVEIKRRNDAERTIFDILINNSPEMVEKIGIKHITGEK
jgi:hypothetical protein